MVPKTNPRGHSFKGIIVYLMHDKNRSKTSERLAWYATGNMYTDDPFKAAKVMAWTDKNANFLKQKSGTSLSGAKVTAGAVYHYSLAWAIGEEPSEEHQKEQCLATLERLKMSDHEHVLVAHNDTKHIHVHVVVNLTHPETGKRNELTQDQRVLQKWALDYERIHGIHCRVREENAQRYALTGKPTKHRDEKQWYSIKVTRAFELSDNGKSFIQALKAEGFHLARSRREGRVSIVDQTGTISTLARNLDPIDKYGTPITHGRKGVLIKERLKDIDYATLPDAGELSKQIKEALEKVNPKADFKQASKLEENPEPQQNLYEEFRTVAEAMKEQEVTKINNEDEQNTEEVKQQITASLEKIAKQAALEVTARRAERQETKPENKPKEAEPEEKNIEERETQPTSEDHYEYDRDAEETARQIALIDAAHEAAEKAMSDEVIREQAAQKGLQEMVEAEEAREKAEAERYAFLGEENTTAEQKPEQSEQPEQLLKKPPQDAIKIWPVPSFASTYRDNDTELLKESRLREEIEKRRQYWKIPKLEKEKREADQRLKEHSGWFYRIIRRNKYAQAKHEAWAKGQSLDNARWHWRGDIEEIYKDRDQAFINQELIKRGFEVEFAKPTQDIQHKFKSSANDNHPKDDNLSVEGTNMDEKLSREPSEQGAEEKFEKLKEEEEKTNAEQTLKSTREKMGDDWKRVEETAETEEVQKTNEWHYDVLDADMVDKVIEERIEQIVERKIEEREAQATKEKQENPEPQWEEAQNKEAQNANDNQTEQKEGLSKEFSEQTKEQEFDEALFKKMHEQQQAQENKNTRTLRR